MARRDGVPAWRRRKPRAELLVWAGWLAALALTLACFRFISERTIRAFVWDAPRQGGDLLARMVPPRWSDAAQLWRPLWDTINIATLGTLLAVLAGVPLACLAAHNTTPSALPVLVIILGSGERAGILAIALRSLGFVAKLLYEAIEEIDATQVEALAATGASRAQLLGWGIVPQVTLAFAGITVFRWDINIREATALGLVGAGGIGRQLEASINMLAWPQVTMIFLLIFATVLASEWLSARLRHAII